MSSKGRKKKRHHFGFKAAVLAILLLALMFYTVLNTQPKELSLGVVSLDEGAYTPEGQKSNLGEQMVKKITSGEVLTDITGGSSEESKIGNYTIEFKSYPTEEELNKALDNNDVYGAVVIPQDYTTNQLDLLADDVQNAVGDTVGNVAAGAADAVGSTTSKAVDVVMNSIATPEMTRQATSTVTETLSTLGVDDPQVKDVTPYDGKPERFMSDIWFHILLLIPPLICGLLLSRAYRVRKYDELPSRIKRLLISMVLCAILSFLLSILVYFALVYAVDFPSEPIPSVMFMWAVDFLLMTFVMGVGVFSFNFSALAAAVLVLLGAIFGFLPIADLPPVALNLIYPWLTTTFTDISLRGAVASGSGAWVNGLEYVWVYALIGIIVGIAASAFCSTEEGRDRHKDEDLSFYYD